MLRYGYFIQRGSSPRVRSRHALYRHGMRSIGIISACAEQTWACPVSSPPCWDHLRVCGADFRAGNGRLRSLGSSPRVRSRPTRRRCSMFSPRIISACAEQTAPSTQCPPPCRDHLRVCGADQSFPCETVERQGSSPRVRSRLLSYPQSTIANGIISACAEQTHCYKPTSFYTSGSSPRVRSRHEPMATGRLQQWIISACAEQTSGN